MQMNKLCLLALTENHPNYRIENGFVEQKYNIFNK